MKIYKWIFETISLLLVVFMWVGWMGMLIVTPPTIKSLSLSMIWFIGLFYAIYLTYITKVRLDKKGILIYDKEQVNGNYYY